MLKIILIVVGFISVLLFCLSYNTKDLVEGFGNNDCPNILVQKGMRIELTNTRKAKVPGVNPIYFDNLDEYTEFIKFQRANGIKCPILAFKETVGANGENMFSITKELSSDKVMPQNLSYSTRLHPLYDANSDDPPFNQGPQSGFDEEDQNIGRYTKLDKNGGLGTFNESYEQQGGDFLYGNSDRKIGKMSNREKKDHRINLDSVRPQLGFKHTFEPFPQDTLGTNIENNTPKRPITGNIENNTHHDQIDALIEKLSSTQSSPKTNDLDGQIVVLKEIPPNGVLEVTK